MYIIALYQDLYMYENLHYYAGTAFPLHWKARNGPAWGWGYIAYPIVKIISLSAYLLILEMHLCWMCGDVPGKMHASYATASDVIIIIENIV